MGNRRRQGNVTPLKVNNHTIEDLMDSEGSKTSVSEFKRMISMYKEFKEEIQNQANEFQKNMDK
jgi:hypothetical protein